MIDENNNQVGIVNYNEAKNLAANKKLDLILISPNATPPVYKMMDYGKYKYEQTKNIKKPATIVVKEVRFKPDIGEHDIQFKLKNIKKFLASKNKVKLVVVFKGRQIIYSEAGMKLLDYLAAETVDVAIVEKKAALAGRSITMVLSPK